MNFILTMSGGTTPVINSTLVGVIRGIKRYHPHSKLFIPKPGIVGILRDEIYELDLNALNRLTLKRIQRLPGSSLTGTSRIERFDKEQLTTIDSKLKELNVTTFINIGGSGTIKQTKYLSENISNVKFIALPKTIDNDLGDSNFEQLLFTPGYLSSARYLINHTYNLIRENEGAYFNDTVLVSQVFGRDTSHLAAITNLVNSPRLITLFPESPLSKEEFLSHVNKRINDFGGCVVVVPEGYDSTIFDTDFTKEYDESGQVKWGSSHGSIAQTISSYLNNNGINTRIVNTTIEQRQCGSFLDSTDIDVAYRVGYDAIKLRADNSFFMSITRGNKTMPIKISEIELDNFNRSFPPEWIDSTRTRVNNLFKAYFKSLKLGQRIISEVNEIKLPLKPVL